MIWLVAGWLAGLMTGSDTRYLTYLPVPLPTTLLVGSGRSTYPGILIDAVDRGASTRPINSVR